MRSKARKGCAAAGRSALAIFARRACAVLPSCATSGALAQPNDIFAGTPLAGAMVVEIGRDLALGSISAKIARNGDVLAFAYTTAKACRLSPEGRVIAAFGRKGDGPGEFRFASHIAEGLDGSIYVYDAGFPRISQFSAEGKFVKTWGLSPPLAGVESFLALPRGGFAFAGEISNPNMASHAIHIYDSTFHHVWAFAEFSRPRSPDLEGQGRPGSLTLAFPDTLLVSSRVTAPFEITWYTVAGRIKRRVKLRTEVIQTIDDAYRVFRNGNQISIATRKDIVQPAVAFQLDSNTTVAGYSDHQVVHWTFIDRAGRIPWTGKAPVSMGFVGHAPNGALWFSGRSADDEPVLFLLKRQ